MEQAEKGVVEGRSGQVAAATFLRPFVRLRGPEPDVRRVAAFTGPRPKDAKHCARLLGALMSPPVERVVHVAGVDVLRTGDRCPDEDIVELHFLLGDQAGWPRLLLTGQNELQDLLDLGNLLLAAVSHDPEHSSWGHGGHADALDLADLSSDHLPLGGGDVEVTKAARDLGAASGVYCSH